MKFFEFKLTLTNPTTSIDPLNAEIESIHDALTANPALSSVDIVAEGSEKVAFLIGSGTLDIDEIDALLILALTNAGRTPDSYTITAPQDES